MIPVTYRCYWTQPEEEARKETFKELADAGITRITLSDGAIRDFIQNPDFMFRMKKELKEYGLQVMDAHAPWGTWRDPGMPLEEYHDAVVNYQKLALFVAQELGVTTMAYHTGNTLPGTFGPLPFEAYEKMLIRSLEELLPLAEKYDFIMALENQWTPLNSSRSLMKILKHFNSPNLGFCYDSGHAHLTECGSSDPEKSCVPALWKAMDMEVEWEEDWIGMFKDHVVCSHLHSNEGFADSHILPEKDDGMPWKHIMDVFAEAPRLQCVQFEVNQSPAVQQETARKLFPCLES